MAYIDKYRSSSSDGLSLYNILTKVGTTEYINGDIKEYKAVGIDYVKIDSNKFTNYGQYQFIWEKTFIKSPERSADGSLGNLNSYATFLTPHLIMDFSVMSIDDYRAIMKMHYEKNEFTVECYDAIYNKPIKVKMYFATEEMAKLFTISQHRLLPDGKWEDWVDLVGVTDYKVELIGTNNDLDYVSVVYHLNPPKGTGFADLTIGEDDIYKGEEIAIGGAAASIKAETFGGLYKFTKWNVSSADPTVEKDQGNYIDGYAYTINTDLVLYAQWQSMGSHTLTFNYGLADPIVNEIDGSYETSRTVVEGDPIGTMPTFEFPKVDGVVDSPYLSASWWKTPIKMIKYDENGNDITDTLKVNASTPYWSNRDSSIYLLFDVKSYSLTLYIDGEIYQENDFEYNTPMNLPMLVKSGYTFDGWYSTSDFKDGTKVSGNMPPYDLTLYARWVKN